MRVNNANFSSFITQYDILECMNCGLSRMHPFPVERDIKEIYIQEELYPSALQRMVNPYKGSIFFNILDPLYNKYASSRRYGARKCIKLAKRRESVLEIGCATGHLLKEFYYKDKRLDITGIDIDPNAKRKAPQFLKDKIIIGDFLEHNFSRKFDIVALCFSLEHIINIKDYIKKAVDLLNPEGLLFIAVPDIDSPQANFQRSAWRLIDERRFKIGHVHWFNRKSMQYMADLYDLKLRHCGNTGELIYHLPVKIQNFLRKLLGADPRGGRFIKYYAPRIIWAIVFDALLSQFFGYGDCIFAYMEKKDKRSRFWI